jgi:hypothetical protein
MNHSRNDDLALAAAHVAQGQIIVVRQRERIERLKALGCSTAGHEETLRVFTSTLQIFIEHELALRESAVSSPPPPSKDASLKHE